MGDEDMDWCYQCGAAVSTGTRSIHWDWHRDQTQKLRELEEQIAELVRERNAAIDARREEAERA